MKPKVEILQPTTALPRTLPSNAPITGSIYQSAQYRPFFEDRKARNVGDTLVIQINENISATQSVSSNASRQGNVAAGIPTDRGLPFGIPNLSLAANSNISNQGKGESANKNVFTGTITVTVVDVLPNGNLVVSGEKQIGLNRQVETVRLSGVVNPAFVTSSNIVSSTQVADARLEYHGAGDFDEVTAMGWLSRVFLNFLPF